MGAYGKLIIILLVIVICGAVVYSLYASVKGGSINIFSSLIKEHPDWLMRLPSGSKLTSPEPKEIIQVRTPGSIPTGTQPQ